MGFTFRVPHAHSANTARDTAQEAGGWLRETRVVVLTTTDDLTAHTLRKVLWVSGGSWWW